ncbi:MAG: TlpA disulfide reductase family protein [Chromatiales bacterium]
MKILYSTLPLLGVLSAFQGPAQAGNPLADCRPVELETGKTLDLADYGGKVLYVDFWASWCAPCRETFPFMNALHEEFGGDGLHVLAISLDDDAEEARGFLEDFPADFQVAIDSSGSCPIAFEVLGMPSSYILGRDGAILNSHMGFSASDAEELQAEVSEALR